MMFAIEVRCIYNRERNGEKLSSTQAESDQVSASAVAHFLAFSGAASHASSLTNYMTQDTRF